MRYIYETKVLPLPAAMMLFSVRLLSRLVIFDLSDLSAALGRYGYHLRPLQYRPEVLTPYT